MYKAMEEIRKYLSYFADLNSEVREKLIAVRR